MGDEQLEVEYENAELRFYDRETYERNLRTAVSKEKVHIFLLPHGADGRTIAGSAAVLRHSLRNPHEFDTIYFIAACGKDPILADECTAQLWEVYPEYKRRIV